jgi:hypothetical protein
MFEKSSTKLVGQSTSNGQIHALNEYLQTFEGQQTNVFHDGSDTYMTKEQYAMVKLVGLNFISCLLYFYYFYCTIKCVQISIAWLKDHPEAYWALCKIWANEEFIAKSMKAQESRGTGRSGHTCGPNGHKRMCKLMVRKIITKMHSYFLFSLLTHTHRSVQVTLQTPTSCAL